ncbi:glutathione-dependent formaldehyde-activating enzyme [Xylaria sp. FL0043]|nr:glutathione-dependent formaldehyde-activating enzyme [Xylaria sp. FL0043]
MGDQEVTLKTYRANCHCTAYVYEVTLPEISKASQCNCSVCYKKGALWVFPKPADVKFVKGDPATLSDYTFGKKVFVHKSCSTCGNSIMFIRPPHPGESEEVEMGINVRLNCHLPSKFKVSHVNAGFDGASLFQPAYEPPKFTGEEPAAEIEGGKLYTGSCHCGAVTLALKSKPLDKNFTGDILECNCSSCAKAGYIWTYPEKSQVVIEGKETLAMYTFGRKTSGKTFCKICSIPIHNEVLKFTDEELAAKIKEDRDWILGGQNLAPVNLRIINNLDVSDLNVSRFQGYTAWHPPYVEP